MDLVVIIQYQSSALTPRGIDDVGGRRGLKLVYASSTRNGVQLIRVRRGLVGLEELSHDGGRVVRAVRFIEVRVRTVPSLRLVDLMRWAETPDQSRPFSSTTGVRRVLNYVLCQQG